MSTPREPGKSVPQLVANRGRDLRLSRMDMFTAYVMDRLLHRLGASRHAREFFLKGGVLVANLLHAPHRFTRDIDLLRKRGPADADDMRRRFRDIVAVRSDDGVRFDMDSVRAQPATRERDGYDGVRVSIKAWVGNVEVDVCVDIGFGDAVVPPALRTQIKPFLPDDPPARVFAYPTESVLAEKIETVVSRFPAIAHRLKDILDVVTLAAMLTFDGERLTASLAATCERRRAVPDVEVLDDMRRELRGARWDTAWATMCKEKFVADRLTLRVAVERFDAFVRPLLASVRDRTSPGHWRPNGPWVAGRDE